MSRKNNHQKMEEKPVDYLDELMNTPIIEEPTEEIKIDEIIKKPTYKIKVNHPALRIRRAPNTQAEVVGVIRDEGRYEILDEVNGWGMIGENQWIMLSYTMILNR